VSKRDLVSVQKRPSQCPKEPILGRGLGARQTGLGAKARDKMVLEFRASILA